MAARKLLIAKRTFVCEVDGKELRVHAGDVVSSSHPAVKGREELFEAAGPLPAPAKRAAKRAAKK